MATTTVPAAQLQEWGPNQSEAAAVSASVFGARTLQGLTSLQMEWDSDALAIAQWYTGIYSFPIRRVQQMQVDSWANGGNNIPQMLSRQIYDRITVSYAGQSPGPAFQQDSLIESISHHIQMDSGPTWSVVWACSPYEVLLTPFIFGINAQSQLAGAASVTGSGTSWIHHPSGQNYLSGTVVFTVANGSTTTVAYNATAAVVQTALVALVPGTTVTGGPLNTTNVVITFGSSQSNFSGFFHPSQSLTL